MFRKASVSRDRRSISSAAASADTPGARSTTGCSRLTHAPPVPTRGARSGGAVAGLSKSSARYTRPDPGAASDRTTSASWASPARRELHGHLGLVQDAGRAVGREPEDGTGGLDEGAVDVGCDGGAHAERLLMPDQGDGPQGDQAEDQQHAEEFPAELHGGPPVAGRRPEPRGRGVGAERRGQIVISTRFRQGPQDPLRGRAAGVTEFARRRETGHRSTNEGLT